MRTKAIHLRGFICSAIKTAQQNYTSFEISSTSNRSKVTCKSCLRQSEG